MAMSYLFVGIDRDTLEGLKYFLSDIQIVKKLLQILANFSDKPQLLSTIKIPFLNCSSTICYIFHKWNITNKYLPPLTFIESNRTIYN